MTFEPGSNPKFLFGNDLKPINWLVSYKKKKKKIKAQQINTNLQQIARLASKTIFYAWVKST